MNWFLQALKKYAVFSGRARRKEYWFFVLFYLLIAIPLTIVDAMVFGMSESGIGILSAIFMLGMLIPSIAVAIRRLHDTNRSGWWVLVSLIPFVGPFILLYFMIKAGDSGSNNYGDDPIAAET